MVSWAPRTLPYWEDLPSTDTPVDDDALNRFEAGIDESVKSDTATEIWTGTQAAYDLLTPDASTLYFIVG